MTAKIKLNAASGGGSISIQAPSSSSNNRVISLPDIADGTLVTSQSTLDATKLSGNLPALNGSALTNLDAGKILNLQKTTHVGQQTIHSSSYISLTSMSITVNPTSTNSKFLLMYQTTAEMNGTRGMFDIYNGSAYLGAAAGGSQLASFEDGPHKNTMLMFQWVDSPSTTSAITYTVRCKTDGVHQCYINKDGHVSHFVVMEIAS